MIAAYMSGLYVVHTAEYQVIYMLCTQPSDL